MGQNGGRFATAMLSAIDKRALIVAILVVFFVIAEIRAPSWSDVVGCGARVSPIALARETSHTVDVRRHRKCSARGARTVNAMAGVTSHASCGVELCQRSARRRTFQLSGACVVDEGSHVTCARLDASAS